MKIFESAETGQTYRHQNSLNRNEPATSTIIAIVAHPEETSPLKPETIAKYGSNFLQNSSLEVTVN
jgi:hypothetical protein